MQPSTESRSFLQKLLQNPPSLPFESALLPMLFAVTREDSKAPTDDLVALIERSQKLASHVLTIANSALYGMEFKVSTLRRAVSILGVCEIRTLVILSGTAAVFKEAKLPKDFNAAGLWSHQLKVAAVAKVLACELGGPSGVCGPSAAEEDRLVMLPDEAYVAGLLHDIGKVFFAISRPDLWEIVEECRRKNGQRFCEAEDAYWGMDHALIGAEVLHIWKLPLLLTEPINWHHAPELAPAYKMDARLLAAADCIVHNEPDAEGRLCEEALALLPEGCDAAALGMAAAQCLDDSQGGILTTLVP
ncbi:Metal dependent phosphohydrolase [uncultured delta proteobacterium]|uniref:Metal dependent phosphohydrolase n=1 Tax=uncultured delta proteobacterium TaxID=34034 RepID=A0A212J8L3_9DELT|nr:Metal dependent phosphohydrolase [uncultured delta proteobacterium]